MKNNSLGRLIFVFSICFLFSCSPKLTVSIKKNYPPQEGNEPIVFYKKPQDMPIESEKVGTLQVHCVNGMKKCDSVSIFSLAEKGVKKSGGNALLITKFKEPTLWNSSYLLNGDILMISDFSLTPDTLYTMRKLKTSETYGKGTWDLRLSLPYINQFVLRPNEEGTISSFGFLGALIGADYYHQHCQYLSFFLGAGMDFFLPVPAPVDYEEGEEQFVTSVYLGLTNNHRLKYFTLGYGLSYSGNSWRLYYGHDENLPPNKSDFKNAFGLAFSAYYMPASNFSIGVMYRPSMIRINSGRTFCYEHLISIDFAWKIRLKTRQKSAATFNARLPC